MTMVKAFPSEFIANASTDLQSGVLRWGLWGRLGWQDILMRYRRSVLGPFWLTLSTAIMVAAMGTLYSVLFQLPAADYIPFLALGLIIWGFINSILSEGCNTFIEAESVLKQIAMPKSIFVCRVVWRAFLLMVHSLPIYLVLLVWFQIQIGWSVLLAFPALLLLLGHALWISLLFGMISARFRDFPQIVASIVQIAFFLTPIVWKPELLRGRMLIVEANPLYHVIEILRGPLLGTPPEALSWIVVCTMLIAGWVLTFWAFARFRPRIVYWV
ncbi:MAG: ABC transporter permease [Alphaproteobacteria bacterium]|nr:ABC transporter permease [Alphaproteobacteria bacterium]